MKFTLENIGPIREKADITLGDLTIIAGKNNTGKTYVAHTLYGFLYRLYEPSLAKEHPGKTVISTYLPTEDYIEMHIDGINLDVKSVSGKSKFTVMEADGRRFSRKMLKKINDRFLSFEISRIFSSEEEQFKDARIACELSPQKDKQHIPLSECVAEFTAPVKQNPFFTVSFRDAEIPLKAMMHIIKREIFSYFIGEERRMRPFILSAERPGIPLFYKDLDSAKNDMAGEPQSLAYGKKKDPMWFTRQADNAINKDAPYAQPIKHHINYIRNLGAVQKEKSDFTGSKLLKDIENMMGGYYRYVNDEIRFISKKKDLFNIPLYLASSSGQELASFYFYIKHIAKKGQLLIIDEPESHLDTTNQILLARLLARCVNAGLKVLVTTHSDYLVKELNNLIMLSHEFKYRDLVIKKFGYSEEDYIKAESIKAYVCEESGVAPCKMCYRGMKMPVFDDTIVSINAASNTLSIHMPEDE